MGLLKDFLNEKEEAPETKIDKVIALLDEEDRAALQSALLNRTHSAERIVDMLERMGHQTSPTMLRRYQRTLIAKANDESGE